MEPADLGQLDHLADLRRLDVPVFRAILSQRQMRAGATVVGKIALENPAQVSLSQHDDMIQALSPDRADESFDVRILPWRSRCREHLFDAHSSDPGSKYAAVAATDQGCDAMEYGKDNSEHGAAVWHALG